jgi:AhpD family alkylhydroperoxidase
MSWIKSIEYDEAGPDLKRIYDRVKGPNDNVDNVLTVHSQRPHTLLGHMTLYKSVLHNTNNTLPKWYLEAIGIYVSYLNGCSYCVHHHGEGLKRLLNDEHRTFQFLESVVHGSLDQCFDDQYYQGMLYAEKLTLHLEDLEEEDIARL